MTAKERFAQDWLMPLDAVQQLVVLARKAGRFGEHICNGDRPGEPVAHDATDKSANAEYWRAKQNRTDQDIVALIVPYGFTGIEYTGIGPTLRRGDRFVEIPY